MSTYTFLIMLILMVFSILKEFLKIKFVSLSLKCRLWSAMHNVHFNWTKVIRTYPYFFWNQVTETELES